MIRSSLPRRRAEMGVAFNRNKALFEDPTGKGQVVEVGTYIGTAGGRVTAILPDKARVEEEAEDVLGKVTAQIREVRLSTKYFDTSH